MNLSINMGTGWRAPNKFEWSVSLGMCVCVCVSFFLSMLSKWWSTVQKRIRKERKWQYGDKMTMHMHICPHTHIRSCSYGGKYDMWHTRAISLLNRHWLLRTLNSIHNAYVIPIMFSVFFPFVLHSKKKTKQNYFRGGEDFLWCAFRNWFWSRK